MRESSISESDSEVFFETDDDEESNGLAEWELTSDSYSSGEEDEDDEWEPETDDYSIGEKEEDEEEEDRSYSCSCDINGAQDILCRAHGF